MVLVRSTQGLTCVFRICTFEKKRTPGLLHGVWDLQSCSCLGNTCRQLPQGKIYQQGMEPLSSLSRHVSSCRADITVTRSHASPLLIQQNPCLTATNTALSRSLVLVQGSTTTLYRSAESLLHNIWPQTSGMRRTARPAGRTPLSTAVRSKASSSPPPCLQCSTTDATAACFPFHPSRRQPS